jgi:hypothetical protein
VLSISDKLPAPRLEKKRIIVPTAAALSRRIFAPSMADTEAPADERYVVH